MVPDTKILLIDDEPSILKLLETFLGKRGYETISAESVEEGLNIMAAEKIDIVICDIVLPERDGYHFLERSKRKYPGIPVIMMTGQADTNSVKKSMQSGAEDFIMKPINFSELAQIVERITWKSNRDKKAAEPVKPA